MREGKSVYGLDSAGREKLFPDGFQHGGNPKSIVIGRRSSVMQGRNQESLLHDGIIIPKLTKVGKPGRAELE